MAKHLKQNQIKSGMTIYVVHPKYSSIEEKFIVSKPKKDTSKHGCGFIKFEYLPVRHFTITEKGIVGEKNNSVYRHWLSGTPTPWGVCSGYCGDDGIPNKDGVFIYKQERRAFPTLNKAIAYWVSQQSELNKFKWAVEDEEWED